MLTRSALQPIQIPFTPPPTTLPLERNGDTAWMERLLRRAAVAGVEGEVPVAAVVLDGRGRAIGWGSNRRHRNHDPLGHAELVALARAARLRRSWRFPDCSLLVPLEPCPMCAGALVRARMGRVVFAAWDPTRGARGSCVDWARPRMRHNRREGTGGWGAAR